MVWANVGLFFIAAVKFLFAAAAGRGIGNDFMTTLIVISLGGITGVTVFYYFINEVVLFLAKIDWLSNGFKKLWANIRGLFGLEKYPVKKTFKPFNRFYIRVKNSPYGVYVIALLGATIASIPVGAVLAANFYKDKKSTIFILYAAVLLVAFITTYIVYLF